MDKSHIVTSVLGSVDIGRCFCRNISEKEIETSARNEREMLEKLQRGIGNEMEAEDREKTAIGSETGDKPRRTSNKKKSKNDNPAL